MRKPIIIALHLAYWCFYILLWTLLVILMNGPSHHETRLNGEFAVRFLTVFALLPGLLGFYLHYGPLFHRFLSRRKVLQLVAASVVTSAVCGIVSYGILYGLWWQLMPGSGPGPAYGGADEVVAFMLIMSGIAFLNGLMGLVMQGFLTWFAGIRQREQLLRKNHEMELALMKAQLQPHFLFNTLNNIDVLIARDPARASRYLLALSDLLRFMLYETKPEQIPLSKELDHIGNYIELQRIRSADPDYVRYTVEGDATGREVAPLLFIPFIENAFKHGEDLKAAGAVRVHFRIVPGSIIFECVNTYRPANTAQPEPGGLGMELIGKRLQLLYPGRHTLKVTDADNAYTVELTVRNA